MLNPKKYHIKIERDEDPPNPRKDFDNLGTMVCWHPRYELGDVQPKEAPCEYLLELIEKYDPGYRKRCPDFRLVSLEEVLTRHYAMRHLFLLDHSGLSLSTRDFGDPWDSGRVGLIYVSFERLNDLYGWKRMTPQRRRKAEEWLRNEVETYDQFLRGEVYYFEITDQDGRFYDSCGGFYGHDYQTNGMTEHWPEGWAPDQIEYV